MVTQKPENEKKTTWIIASDETYYPSVDEYTTEEEARTEFEFYRNNPNSRSSNIYLAEVKEKLPALAKEERRTW